ncbi:MAG: hypothetical protein ACOYEQ_00815 [Bacillota bacterium]|jgi:hypothetical protein
MSMLGITWQGSVTGEATGIAILCVWPRRGKIKARGARYMYTNQWYQGVNSLESRRVRKKQRRTESIESGYIAVVITLLCLVAVIQGLLRFDSMRRFMNETIRLEGEPLARAVSGLKEPFYTWIEWPPAGSGQQSTNNTGILCIRFIGKPNKDVWILINGKAAKRFDDEDGVIVCRDGDLIEIIAEKGQANVVVSAAGSNIVHPQVGTWVKGEGILLLGRVKLTED